MVPYQKVFEHLAKEEIRYVVVGGFAVNFYQVQRATLDLDLIVQIEPNNLLKFVHLMKLLQFIPRVPVDPIDLSNAEIRSKINFYCENDLSIPHPL